MSNFSESHKIINKEIVTNGEGDITGEVMNDVLNTMLDDTKTHIDNLENKTADLQQNKSNILYMKQAEYDNLRETGQIVENNIYVILKAQNPWRIYIGNFKFAEKDFDPSVSVGFPYTFPIIF